jgi:hypothetical protein
MQRARALAASSPPRSGPPAIVVVRSGVATAVAVATGSSSMRRPWPPMRSA